MLCTPDELLIEIRQIRAEQERLASGIADPGPLKRPVRVWEALASICAMIAILAGWVIAPLAATWEALHDEQISMRSDISSLKASADEVKNRNQRSDQSLEEIKTGQIKVQQRLDDLTSKLK